MKNLIGLIPAFLMATAFAAENSPDFHDRLGIQLWSLQAQFKTEKVKTLDHIKDYGLKEVETYGGTGLSPADLAKECKARGLDIVSCHIGYDAFKKDTAAVIREAQAMGAKYIFIPYADKFKNATADSIRALASEFNAFGAKCKLAGIGFGLHNHGIEYGKIGEDDDTAYDLFVRETTPELVSFELDIFWAVQAGQDPVKLLKKYPKRFVALHVKDMRKGATTGPTPGHAEAADNVAVGTGQMDWPAILRQAQEDGVRYYFIEDETPAPLQNIPASLKYLRTLKL